MPPSATLLLLVLAARESGGNCVKGSKATYNGQQYYPVTCGGSRYVHISRVSKDSILPDTNLILYQGIQGFKISTGKVVQSHEHM